MDKYLDHSCTNNDHCAWYRGCNRNGWCHELATTTRPPRLADLDDSTGRESDIFENHSCNRDEHCAWYRSCSEHGWCHNNERALTTTTTTSTTTSSPTSSITTTIATTISNRTDCDTGYFQCSNGNCIPNPTGPDMLSHDTECVLHFQN
jgi:hypothetical protein